MSKSLVCNFSIRKGNHVFDHRYVFSWLLFQRKSSTIIISSIWCHISFQMFRQPTYLIENSICSRALNFQKAWGRYTKFLGLIFFTEVMQDFSSPICQLAYVDKLSQEQSSNPHCQDIYTLLLLIKSQSLHIQLISLNIRKHNHVHIKLFLPSLDTGFCYIAQVFLKLAACLPPIPRCWEYRYTASWPTS